MSIDNALASVAVHDLEAASVWYEKLLGHPRHDVMPGVAQWQFPRGGCIQVFQESERAGKGSVTFSVSDIEDEKRKLAALGIAVEFDASTARAKVLMIKDPDGNSIAFAEAIDAVPVKVD